MQSCWELTLSAAAAIPIESRVKTGLVPPHFILSTLTTQGVRDTTCAAIVFGKNVSSCQIALFLSSIGCSNTFAKRKRGVFGLSSTPLAGM